MKVKGCAGAARRGPYCATGCSGSVFDDFRCGAFGVAGVFGVTGTPGAAGASAGAEGNAEPFLMPRSPLSELIEIFGPPAPIFPLTVLSCLRSPSTRSR